LAITTVSAALGISAEPPAGSTVTNTYMDMNVVVYAVPEPVAEAMSILNGLATLFFSLAALAASLPIGIEINSMFVDTMPAGQQKAINLAFWVGLIFCVILAGLAGYCTIRRISTWGQVKRASQARR
jgi:TRAP-type C4-dicarboxylate transport system permease small subunit